MPGYNAGPQDHLLTQETLCKKLSFLQSCRNWIMSLSDPTPKQMEWLKWAADRIYRLEQFNGQ